MDYSVDVITQFDLPSRTAVERILCHFSSDNFDQYPCTIHESIGRRFCNRAVASVFFNNKKKLSIDSAVIAGVKDWQKSKLEIFINLNFYFIF